MGFVVMGPYGLGGLEIEHAVVDRGRVVVRAAAAGDRAECPLCGRASGGVHSRYARTVADLPRHGTPVTLRVRVRRFFCENPRCERKIFCERLPEVEVRARKTARLERALVAIALELGGEAGARLARELGLAVSPDVFLDRIRRVASTADRATRGRVRVLGVDDFAFRKGTEYGTILVDLERRRVVDLLPDRSAAGLTEWLREHPGVEVVSRDRFPAYADGISAGAPQATQVADRWHLVRNLAEALDEFLVHKRHVLEAAAGTDGAKPAAGEEGSPEEAVAASSAGPMTPNRPRLWYARQQEAAKKRHERLVEQWREIRRLQAAGADVADIARKLGISPHRLPLRGPDPSRRRGAATTAGARFSIHTCPTS